MQLKRIGLDSTINNRRVKVYNVDEKKLIADCPTMAEASDITGVTSQTIFRCIQKKSRNTKNKLGLTLAFR